MDRIRFDLPDYRLSATGDSREAAAPRRATRLWLRALLFLIKLLIAAVLPFVVLIRGAVFLYGHYGLNVWLALAVGAGMTALVLMFYLRVLRRRVFGRRPGARGGVRLGAGLVGMALLVYCGYTLVYISAANAKTTETHREFTSLHPLLRLAVGTVLLADRDLLITDVARDREDYGRMGLRPARRSLHYPQADGYVHAVDLRTAGRGEVRNWLLAVYFRSMGFHTLRHVGSGDHLHISIPTHDRPNAI